MNLETELTLAAVLRRNAHELRNKLSALISALDVMESAAPDAAPSGEAIGMLAETGADLRALADGWTRSAVAMFEQNREDIDCDELADAVAAATGISVDREPADVTIKVDRRIIEAAVRRIADIVEPESASVRRIVRHDLPFVIVELPTTADRAAAAIESEVVLAMLDQLSAHPRIDGDTLTLQIPAKVNEPAS